MQEKIFDKHRCMIAASLERVGERWSILILRESFLGSTHFDQFEKRLGIAPNMLTRRLKMLVQEGLLMRRQYSKRPPRFEYVLTERGRDFRPILLSLLVWGNRHFAPEGMNVQLVNSVTGDVVEPLLIDRISGTPLDHRSSLTLRANDEVEAVNVAPVSVPESTLTSKPSNFSEIHCSSEEF